MSIKAKLKPHFDATIAAKQKGITAAHEQLYAKDGVSGTEDKQRDQKIAALPEAVTLKQFPQQAQAAVAALDQQLSSDLKAKGDADTRTINNLEAQLKSAEAALDADKTILDAKSKLATLQQAPGGQPAAPKKSGFLTTGSSFVTAPSPQEVLAILPDVSAIDAINEAAKVTELQEAIRKRTELLSNQVTLAQKKLADAKQDRTKNADAITQAHGKKKKELLAAHDATTKDLQAKLATATKSITDTFKATKTTAEAKRDADIKTFQDSVKKIQAALGTHIDATETAAAQLTATMQTDAEGEANKKDLIAQQNLAKTELGNLKAIDTQLHDTLAKELDLAFAAQQQIVPLTLRNQSAEQAYRALQPAESVNTLSVNGSKGMTVEERKTMTAFVNDVTQKGGYQESVVKYDPTTDHLSVTTKANPGSKDSDDAVKLFLLCAPKLKALGDIKISGGNAENPGNIKGRIEMSKLLFGKVDALVVIEENLGNPPNRDALEWNKIHQTLKTIKSSSPTSNPYPALLQQLGNDKEAIQKVGERLPAILKPAELAAVMNTIMNEAAKDPKDAFAGQASWLEEKITAAMIKGKTTEQQLEYLDALQSPTQQVKCLNAIYNQYNSGFGWFKGSDSASKTIKHLVEELVDSNSLGVASAQQIANHSNPALAKELSKIFAEVINNAARATVRSP